MGSMKGGSETSTEVPQFVTDAGEFGVDRAKQLAEMGYMPYFGPDVAALSPMEYAGMQNTAGAANAFGMASPGMQGAAQGGMQGQPQGLTNQQPRNMQQAQVGDTPQDRQIVEAYQQQFGRMPDQAGYDFWSQNYNPETFQRDFQAGIGPMDTVVDPMTGLPQAGNYGGVSGYSGAPIFTGAQDQLQQRMPGLMDNYNSMFIDPITGTPPSGSSQGAASGGLLGDDPAEIARQRSIEKYGTPDLAHLFTPGYDRK